MDLGVFPKIKKICSIFRSIKPIFPDQFDEKTVIYGLELRKYLKSDSKVQIKTIHGHGFKLLILD